MAYPFFFFKNSITGTQPAGAKSASSHCMHALNFPFSPAQYSGYLFDRRSLKTPGSPRQCDRSGFGDVTYEEDSLV
jgi:hypothetical protein